MMINVLVYRYATGMLSSRKIERRLHKDLAFRILGGRFESFCRPRSWPISRWFRLFKNWLWNCRQRRTAEKR